MRRWRSELAVPGSNRRMMAKSRESGADLVFFDLEDAVAPAEKAAARALIVEALRDQAGMGYGAFRVNALDTPYFYRDFIDVVEGAGAFVGLIVLPKANRPADVIVVDRLLTQLELAVGLTEPIELEVQIETAAGLANCEAIAAASPRIQAITFGPGDMAASLGMPSAWIGVRDRWDEAYSGDRWHYAMSRIVVAARAAGVRAIDGPYADFREPDGLRRSCEVARALGFDGKWCIHPAQVATVNEVFTPSDDEVAWAKRVLEAFHTAAAEGAGAVSLDGRMLDGASARVAKRTLAAAGEEVIASPNL
jgi:citrate lyase subunit beta/citryl-CoA lyase